MMSIWDAPDDKEELVEQIKEVLGYLPDGTRVILSAMCRPDVIDATKRYVSRMDVASLCTNHKAPWSCILEAEARYENVKFGWLGAPTSGVGFAEWWCENCRKKVMGTG